LPFSSLTIKHAFDLPQSRLDAITRSAVVTMKKIENHKIQYFRY